MLSRHRLTTDLSINYVRDEGLSPSGKAIQDRAGDAASPATIFSIVTAQLLLNLIVANIFINPGPSPNPSPAPAPVPSLELAIAEISEVPAPRGTDLSLATAADLEVNTLITRMRNAAIAGERSAVGATAMSNRARIFSTINLVPTNTRSWNEIANRAGRNLEEGLDNLGRLVTQGVNNALASNTGLGYYVIYIDSDTPGEDAKVLLATLMVNIEGFL
ncbi:hypothetical protein BGZ60DRAFT_436497 [Tricladium varicosporioides]|nr:hypothetical protein BGZ60DRAFT_436497 [Hymenoscyphus varicosporioides]